MDRTNFENVKWLNKKTLSIAGGLIVIVAVATFAMKLSRHPEARTHAPKKINIVARFFKDALNVSDLGSTYVQAWENVQNKVADLKIADEERKRLELDVAKLKLDLETARFACHAEKAEAETKKIEIKLSQETGSKVGRVLASIPYSVPTNLLPQQLFTLGMSYFKARDDEKAAVVFSFLTGLEDVATYKTPSNFMITGIAWYRLDNFELAEYYFEKILSQPEQPEILRYQAQARLWRALTSVRLGKHTKAQYWLRELVDYHPHSKEVKWVNNREVNRATASVGSEDESDE